MSAKYLVILRRVGVYRRVSTVYSLDMSMRQVSLIGLFAMSLGCSPSSVPLEPATPTPASEVAVERDDGVSPLATRTLGVGAVFGDVVTAARQIEERGTTDEVGDCTLRRRNSGHWVLEADLASGVNPLPAGVGNIVDELRGGAARWQVLSRWGAVGPASADIAFAAFSSEAPRAGDESLVLIAVGHQRVVWSAIGDPEWGGESVSLSPSGVEAITSLAPDAVLVTAEPNTPLERFRRALEGIDEVNARIGMAIALPGGTALPERDDVGSDVGMCSAAGSVSEAADAGEAGGRSASEIGAGLHPLREGVARCLASAGGGGSAGGLLNVRLDLDASGEVTQVCAEQDEIGSIPLRLCVLERIRSLRFSPAPGPDQVLLPLRLLAPPQDVRPMFCED